MSRRSSDPQAPLMGMAVTLRALLWSQSPESAQPWSTPRTWRYVVIAVTTVKWFSRNHETLRRSCQCSFQAVLTTSLSDSKFKTLSFFFFKQLLSLDLLLSLGVRPSARLGLRKPGTFGELCTLRSCLRGEGLGPKPSHNTVLAGWHPDHAGAHLWSLRQWGPHFRESGLGDTPVLSR